MKEKIINDLKCNNTIEQLEENGKINLDFIDENLPLLMEALEEFGIKTEIKTIVGGQYLVVTNLDEMMERRINDDEE